jgi:hypothetical protein
MWNPGGGGGEKTRFALCDDIRGFPGTEAWAVSLSRDFSECLERARAVSQERVGGRALSF